MAHGIHTGKLTTTEHALLGMLARYGAHSGYELLKPARVIGSGHARMIPTPPDGFLEPPFQRGFMARRLPWPLGMGLETASVKDGARQG